MVHEPRHPWIWRRLDECCVRVRQIRKHAVQRGEDKIRPSNDAQDSLDQKAQKGESSGDTNADSSIPMIFRELDCGNKLPAN